MRKLEALRRVEELTYQVEALTRENTDLAEELMAARHEADVLRQRLKAAEEELRVKYVKIGNLIKDNGRLLNINSYLAEAAGQRKAVRKIDEKGDWIPQEERK